MDENASLPIFEVELWANPNLGVYSDCMAICVRPKSNNVFSVSASFGYFPWSGLLNPLGAICSACLVSERGRTQKLEFRCDMDENAGPNSGMWAAF